MLAGDGRQQDNKKRQVFKHGAILQKSGQIETNMIDSNCVCYLEFCIIDANG